MTKKFYTPELHHTDNELEIKINYQGPFGDIPYEVEVDINGDGGLLFSCYYLSEEPKKNKKDVNRANDVTVCYSTKTGRIYNIQIPKRVLNKGSLEKIIVSLLNEKIIKQEKLKNNRKKMNIDLGIDMFTKVLHKEAMA